MGRNDTISHFFYDLFSIRGVQIVGMGDEASYLRHCDREPEGMNLLWRSLCADRCAVLLFQGKDE